MPWLGKKAVFSRPNKKGQVIPVLFCGEAPHRRRNQFFFLAWLLDHLLAKAEMSLMRLSKSAPEDVTT